MKIHSHSAKEIFYGGRESSTKMSIRKWCKVFSEAGCICKAKGAGRGRITEAKVNEVGMAFISTPGRSASQIALKLPM
jgi:hypothetical protein